MSGRSRTATAALSARRPKASMTWTRAAGQFTFNYWANLSFSRVISDNGSLDTVAAPLAVLGGASVVLLVAVLLIFNARVRRGGWA